MGDMKVKTTRKPCPVCGGTWSREKDKPCPGCQDWIARMRRLEAQLKEDCEIIAVPWASHEFTYIDDVFRDERDAFCKALLDLLMAATSEAPDNRVLEAKHLKSMVSNHYSGPALRYANRGIAEAVDAVHEAATAMVRSANKEGHAKGRNLLVGLAKGDLTVKEFNEASRKAR